MKTCYEGDNAWIPLKDAIKLIVDRICPNEVTRATLNTVRQRINDAEKKGRIFSRIRKGKKVLLHHQSFDTWAVKTWPVLSDVIDPLKLSLHSLTPKRELVFFPPTVDRSTVVLPDNYDALKDLHFSTLDKLLRTKCQLMECQEELAEIAQRDDALRRKRIEAGKKGKGVSRRR